MSVLVRWTQKVMRSKHRFHATTSVLSCSRISMSPRHTRILSASYVEGGCSTSSLEVIEQLPSHSWKVHKSS